MMSKSALFGIATILFALWWDNIAAPFSTPVPQPRVEALLEGFANYTEADDVGAIRVAVGYNANLDLVVGAVEVVQNFLHTHSVPDDFRDHEQIGSFEELLSCLGYWFARGGAAERYITSSEVFLELLQIARKAGGVVALGGNAGLMANNLAEGGHQVLLGAIYDEQIKLLLHRRVNLAANLSSQAREGELEGLYHLILEYPKGATIFGFVAPRANRMIFIRDHLNSRLESLNSFHAGLLEFRPDVAIVSGLHLLSGLPTEVQERQLKAVVDGLLSIPASIPIHLELASMADKQLMAMVVRNIFPVVDSVGLNEQELNATMVALDAELGPGLNPADSRGISSALEALYLIFSNFRYPTWPSHFLTRIHFHCLAFHVVAFRQDVLERVRWKHASLSVFEGSRTASVRACGEDGALNPQNVELLFPQKTVQVKVANERFEAKMELPVTALELSSTPGMGFAVAPVAVCKKPTRTVGLGDAISAAGLVRHLKLA